VGIPHLHKSILEGTAAWKADRSEDAALSTIFLHDCEMQETTTAYLVAVLGDIQQALVMVVFQ
jgi:hypothetical protein